MILVAAAAWANSPQGIAAYGRGDYVTAAREFTRAAEAGDVDSQYMLGRLYAMGLGVPQDYVRAWVWDQRAAAAGNSDANAARADMEAILTPSQLAMARAQSTPAALPPVALTDMSVFPPFPPGSQVAQAPDGMPEISAPRRVVIIPRQGEVGSPTQLSAPGPSWEGLQRATGTLDSQVAVVQRDLAIAGYDPGPADGHFGRRTRRAIHAWQRDHGEPPTGRISADMVTQLEADRTGPQEAQSR
jgi:localization factor PodJL